MHENENLCLMSLGQKREHLTGGQNVKSPVCDRLGDDYNVSPCEKAAIALICWRGESDSEVDTTAAPFESWSAYVDAMARRGIAVSSSSYYRAAYVSADSGS
jgi:hypothetical protein